MNTHVSIFVYPWKQLAENSTSKMICIQYTTICLLIVPIFLHSLTIAVYLLKKLESIANFLRINLSFM